MRGPFQRQKRRCCDRGTAWPCVLWRRRFHKLGLAWGRSIPDNSEAVKRNHLEQLSPSNASDGPKSGTADVRSVTKLQTWMKVMQCRRVYFVGSSLWPIRSLPSKLFGWKTRVNASGRDRIRPVHISRPALPWMSMAGGSPSAMRWASQAADRFLSAPVQHDRGRQTRERAGRTPAGTFSWLTCRASVVDVPGVPRLVSFISPLVGVVVSFNG